MQLLRIKLVNFRQHANTDIALKPGLTAVVGLNGAGKSTLLEAIAFTLFGTQAARGGRDSIRFHRAPPRASVRAEVTFQVGKHVYRVVRGTTTAEVFQDENPAAIATGQTEVTAKVGRILGMTREEFFNTYFTGQKELAVMAQMGPTERGRFLSQVLGFERLKQAQDILRERRSTLRATMEGLAAGMPTRDEVMDEYTDAKAAELDACRICDAAVDACMAAGKVWEQEEPAFTALTERRTRYFSLKGRLEAAKARLEMAVERATSIGNRLHEAIAAGTELETLVPALQEAERLTEEVEALDLQAKLAGERQATEGRLTELRRQLQEARDTVGQDDDITARLERAKELNAAAAERLERSRQLRVETKAALDRATDKQVEAMDNFSAIEAAGVGGACPTCARTLNEAYQVVLNGLQQLVASAVADGAKLENANVDCDRMVEGHVKAFALTDHEVDRLAGIAVKRDYAKAAVDRLADQVYAVETVLAATPLEYDVRRHDAVRARVKELAPALRRAQVIHQAAAGQDTLTGESVEAALALEKRKSEVEEAGRAAQAAAVSDQEYAAAKATYTIAQHAVHVAEASRAEAKAKVDVAEERERQAKKRVQEQEARAEGLRDITAQVHRHDSLDQAFGEIRAGLNAEVRPELAEIASRFLFELTDGRYSELEVDDNYQVAMVEDGVVKPVVSGGEEDVTNIVLRIAISQMIADRAGQPLSLLVLDEIFGSLDMGRQRLVLELLRRLRDRFPQVLLITHIESVREMVDQVLTVELDPATGSSRVTELEGGVV